ncbi:uncharacterized protein LOC123451043 [Hordeum vulgare subsp. vulgare]|uniref:uncharacterized protein LOC123451043 n=1 Tax=Hordeum vulgare subsp. vulgare TaxID=112509 RepID=UPI001D1A34B9|nr:uncharacterized protein LOC123451043 [Hordeum vulgare subsp. vulgare]
MRPFSLLRMMSKRTRRTGTAGRRTRATSPSHGLGGAVAVQASPTCLGLVAVGCGVVQWEKSVTGTREQPGPKEKKRETKGECSRAGSASARTCLPACLPNSSAADERPDPSSTARRYSFQA